MPYGTPPFRIKLSKVNLGYIEAYNRSSFHRNELLIPIRPFTLELSDRKIDISARQIVILPEPISRRLSIKAKDCDHPGEDDSAEDSDKVFAYMLSIATPYLEAIASEFVDTPEIKGIFQDPHVLTLSFITWQHLLQMLGQLELELRHTEDNIQKKLVFNIASLIFLELYRVINMSTDSQLQLNERELLAYEIKQFIQSSFRKNLTLQEIADHFDISTSTVNRIFQPYFHSTIYQFILDLRLNYAYSLIEAGHSITDSWQNAGFNDYSNFYRAFMKHYHIRPHEVPKKHHHEND